MWGERGKMAANGPKVRVVMISGISCGGKTTVVKKLCNSVPHSISLHQDDYYVNEEVVPRSPQGTLHWDCPDALDTNGLAAALAAIMSQPQDHCIWCSTESTATASHVIFIEGTLLLEIQSVMPHINQGFFVTLDYDTSHGRRRARTYPGNTDPVGYFDKWVWPAYLKNLEAAKHDRRIVLVDGSKSISQLCDTIVLGVEAGLAC
ncbi:hypothetical protein EMCRGX_G022544 [Ephydatia muelleri]|eukprot:Em0009g1276a